MQITVTEKNSWEGETFSYILDNITETELKLIKGGLGNVSNVKIDENTSFTKEEVEKLNDKSNNTYMARYQFNELKPFVYTKTDLNWYDDVFYKGVGLERLF